MKLSFRANKKPTALNRAGGTKENGFGIFESAHSARPRVAALTAATQRGDGERHRQSPDPLPA
jgi:hypothetical protein